MGLRDKAEVKHFVKVAQAYCSHLENPTSEKETWIKNILVSLSQLYAAGHTLPEVDVSVVDYGGEDFEISAQEWQSIYQSAADILGEARWYWHHYDPSEAPSDNESPVTGDLADDLADIYGDMKPGLRAWGRNVDEYLPEFIWTRRETLFSSHWGIHAVNALRVLHPLVFLRGLGTDD